MSSSLSHDQLFRAVTFDLPDHVSDVPVGFWWQRTHDLHALLRYYGNLVLEQKHNITMNSTGLNMSQEVRGQLIGPWTHSVVGAGISVVQHFEAALHQLPRLLLGDLCFFLQHLPH